jgi:hypothetical protein
MGTGRANQNGWAMTERESIGFRCQARPAASRHGWREDVLCASQANTSVEFHGVAMPVCKIHEKTYARWGDAAEQQAEEAWGWEPSADHAQHNDRRQHTRRGGQDRREIEANGR